MEKNHKRIILACFVFSLAFFAAAETNSATKKPKCTYIVGIETTCTRGAGTSNRIGLRFGDSKQNDVVVRRLNAKHVLQLDPLYPAVLDDVPRLPFQACTVDEFQVEGPCVDSPICYLYLKSIGGDEWRPGYAYVRATEGEGQRLSSEYFYFRRYLPRHVWHGVDLCERKITPFGPKRKRKVLVKKHHLKHQSID